MKRTAGLRGVAITLPPAAVALSLPGIELALIISHCELCCVSTEHCHDLVWWVSDDRRSQRKAQSVGMAPGRGARWLLCQSCAVANDAAHGCTSGTPFVIVHQGHDLVSFLLL